MFAAWGDESGSVRGVDEGAYIMGAAIAEAEHAEEIREAMRELLLPSQKKVHWRGDDERRHDRIIEAVAALRLEALVVVRVGLSSEKDERRRRKCLEHFLPAIAGLGCSTLTLESRGPADDRRDMTLVAALRSSQRIASSLRVHHVPGPADPALWVADAVCGAVVADRTGRPRWVKALERRLTIEVIDARPG